jgi:hypothetical protein
MPLPYTNRPKVLSGTLSKWFALILMLFFLTASKKAEATHAAGADLSYRCLGGLVYEITATFYRDCGGTAEPGNMTIYYKSASCSFNRTAVANKIPEITAQKLLCHVPLLLQHALVEIHLVFKNGFTEQLLHYLLHAPTGYSVTGFVAEIVLLQQFNHHALPARKFMSKQN